VLDELVNAGYRVIPLIREEIQVLRAQLAAAQATQTQEGIQEKDPLIVLQAIENLERLILKSQKAKGAVMRMSTLRSPTSRAVSDGTPSPGARGHRLSSMSHGSVAQGTSLTAA
jgi:hypothetical protein